MNKARELTEALGRRTIQTTLGIGRTAVGNAVIRGKLPSDWFDALEQVCKTRRIECPRAAFAFKERADV